MSWRMGNDLKYTVESASRAAERNGLAEWVADFLASPGSDNAVLAQQLSNPPRRWLGPVQLPIDQLQRLAGPPGEPVLVPVDEDFWRDDVEEMKELVEEEGWTPPPVIVTWDRGELVVEDGNHRLEGLRRASVSQAWAVVGFTDATERARFASGLRPDACSDE
jgi:ParB-like nuclease domain